MTASGLSKLDCKRIPETLLLIESSLRNAVWVEKHGTSEDVPGIHGKGDGRLSPMPLCAHPIFPVHYRHCALARRVPVGGPPGPLQDRELGSALNDTAINLGTAVPKAQYSTPQA